MVLEFSLPLVDIFQHVAQLGPPSPETIRLAIKEAPKIAMFWGFIVTGGPIGLWWLHNSLSQVRKMNRSLDAEKERRNR